MSMAPSIPSIKINISPHRLPSKPFTVIRSSKAEGPLRRPAAPSLSPPPPLAPPPAQSPPKPVEVAPPKEPEAATAAAAASASASASAAVTLEFQRKVAKELQEYFKQKKLEEAAQGPFFGFLPQNEIGNGRWAMFGFAVGLLTEYATGASFVQQLKILLSNFGIIDLE